MLEFFKMHSLGHDFMVVDLITQASRHEPFPISEWADRITGVGFAYIIIIEQPSKPKADFSLRIFDAAGHAAGNVSGALFCAAHYVLEKGLTGQGRIKFLVAGVAVNIDVKGRQFKMNRGRARLEPQHFNWSMDRYKAEYDLPLEEFGRLNCGVLALIQNHAIVRVDDVEQAPLMAWQSAVRQQVEFPAQTYLNITQVVNEQHIRIDVKPSAYWDESACAAVVSGQLRNWLVPAVVVSYAEQEALIEWSGRAEHPVFISGQARTVYMGQLYI